MAYSYWNIKANHESFRWLVCFLFDGKYLLGVLVQGLEDGAIAALAQLADDIKHLEKIANDL